MHFGTGWTAQIPDEEVENLRLRLKQIQLLAPIRVPSVKATTLLVARHVALRVPQSVLPWAPS
jgi:hypothetical protein